MNLSDVEAHALGSHARLRALLADIDGLCAQVHDGVPTSGRVLRESLRHLSALLEIQVEWERPMISLVLDIDAWGPIRAERLASELAEEEALIAQCREVLASSDDGALASAAELLAEDARHHLRDEERSVFRADVLRDDAVSINQSGG